MQTSKRMVHIAILFFGLTLSPAVSVGLTVGNTAPDFKLTDSDGKVHTLSDYKEKYVVLEWTNYDCPFVAKHYNSGNMQKLQEKYGEKGVIWLSICSSAKGKQGNFPASKINERRANQKAKCTAYLIDADGKIGRTYGAKTTPHIFIIDPKGILIYQGAIDSIPSYEKKRCG